MNVYEHPLKSANFLPTNYVMHPRLYNVGAHYTMYILHMIWYGGDWKRGTGHRETWQRGTRSNI